MYFQQTFSARCLHGSQCGCGDSYNEKLPPDICTLLQRHARALKRRAGYPKTEQFNFMNRWNHEAGKYVAQYGMKYIHEERTGGQDDAHHDIVDPYRISLKTNRGEFYTKQAYVFRNDELAESVAMIASGSFHDQKAIYDRTPYDVTQKNLYVSLMYENDFSKRHNISTGLSLNYDAFDETLQNSPYDRKEVVPSLFAIHFQSQRQIYRIGEFVPITVQCTDFL